MRQLLFCYREGSKYRHVPRRVDFLPNFRLSDEEWEALHLPINLAFFLHSSTAGHMAAFYPSPAGAMESLVGLDAWADLTEANPVLRELEPDVEALLVNRVGETREVYRVGIDLCYHLAGLIRLHWRRIGWGTSGMGGNRTLLRRPQGMLQAGGGFGPCLTCISRSKGWNRSALRRRRRCCSSCV